MSSLRVVEICAGAGGQALGLELAGFEHALAVELDPMAAETLKLNRPKWDVRVGDVADPEVWDPEQFRDVDLLAGECRALRFPSQASNSARTTSVICSPGRSSSAGSCGRAL